MNELKQESVQKIMKDDRFEKIEILKRILNYMHSHFKELCTLFSCVSLLLTCYIKTMIYSCQMGVLKTYNIDKSYIAVNEISIFTLASRLVMALIIIFSNVIIVKISRYSLEFRRRLLKILGILLLETLSISMWSISVYCTGLLEALKAIATSRVSSFCLLFLLNFIFALTINIFSLVEILFCWKKGKQEDRIINLQEIKTCIVVALIAAILLVPAVQGFSEYMEKTKSAYKVAMIHLNDKKQELCAVVYENKDVYIVCPIYQNEGGSGICKNKTIVIDKKGILTCYCDDIHDTTTLKECLEESTKI